ncbi:MAG: magnesium/cobalt transporter CorA [Nocardioidaceae bacterium]
MSRVIVDCAVYHKGERVPSRTRTQDLRTAVEALDDPDDFVWVGLHEPEQAELDELAEVLGLHRLAIEDVVEPHQRPKVERYHDHLFLVLKTLWYGDEGDAVETGEINAFLGKHYFVTVRHGAGQRLDDVRRDLEERQEVLGHGPAAALYAVVDSVVDEYENVAAELQTDIEEVEAGVFAEGASREAGSGQSNRIYRLKREVLEFRRAIHPLREPLGRFVDGSIAFVPEVARPFYRDVADHLARVSDNIDAIDNLLDNALNAHLARLSVQQNEDMRKLAAYAAMFAAPTLIAGVYGMNFTHMPELHWRYGYGICVLVMVVVVALLWRTFKRSGWL